MPFSENKKETELILEPHNFVPLALNVYFPSQHEKQTHRGQRSDFSVNLTESLDPDMSPESD